MTEQQQHLANLVEQRESLKKNIEELQTESNARRELYLKVQGAIEYLSGTGVVLPEPEPTEEETASAEEG
jgi:prefoldin subunit 5